MFEGTFLFLVNLSWQFAWVFALAWVGVRVFGIRTSRAGRGLWLAVVLSPMVLAPVNLMPSARTPLPGPCEPILILPPFGGDKMPESLRTPEPRKEALPLGMKALLRNPHPSGIGVLPERFESSPPARASRSQEMLLLRGLSGAEGLAGLPREPDFSLEDRSWAPRMRTYMSAPAVLLWALGVVVCLVLMGFERFRQIRQKKRISPAANTEGEKANLFGNDLVSLICRIMGAILFFHPLFALAVKELRRSMGPIGERWAAPLHPQGKLALQGLPEQGMDRIEQPRRAA